MKRIIWLVVVLLVGCRTAVPAPTLTPETIAIVPTSTATLAPLTPTSLPATSTPTTAPTSTPAPSSTAIATPTVEPTATETPYAIPTPPGETATEEVLWLYETNNECQLPCWWGIIPGETEWAIAQEFLSRFDKNIFQNSSIPGQTYYGISIPLPTEVFMVGQTELGILDKMGIVEIIETEVSIGDTPPGYLNSYLLSTFLTTYGEPSEVRVFTYRSAFEEGDLPFIVVLFYSDQGIAALYSDNGVSQAGTVYGCPQEAPVSILSLWSPRLNLTFEQLASGSSAFNRNFRPLEEATTIDIPTFYETFKNPDNAVCLETPVNLWR